MDPYARQRFSQTVLLGAERNANVALAAAAEDKAGRQENAALVEHPLGQFLGRGISVGYPAPQEHAHLGGVERAAQGLHDVLGQVAATGVHLDIGLGMPGVIVGVGGSGSQLHENPWL